MPHSGDDTGPVTIPTGNGSPNSLTFAGTLTHVLGQAAAQELGYTEVRVNSFTQIWRERLTSRLLKGQEHPRVEAWPGMVRIASRDYLVTFYLHVDDMFSPGYVVDGISVKGFPDNDNLERVLLRWSMLDLTRLYRGHLEFLQKHPGYQKPLRKKTVAKSRLTPKSEVPEEKPRATSKPTSTTGKSSSRRKRDAGTTMVETTS